MTVTEKIMLNHSDAAEARPGDNIWVRADKLLTHDVCGPGTFGVFQREFGENAEVRRAKRWRTTSALFPFALFWDDASPMCCDGWAEAGEDSDGME